MNMKLLVTSLAATALIGCGGSSSSPTPTPEATPTPTPEVTPTPTPEVTPTPTPEVTPTPTPEVTPTPTPEAVNQVARITDTIVGDTGELRYVIPGDDLLEGKVAASFLKDDNVVDNNEDGSSKNAYITLYNSANSTSSGQAILDFLIGSSSFSIRDQDTITVNTPFTPGEWQDIEITWAAADETSPATVTILIDNDTDNALTYTADARAIGGVSAVAFRFSDNAATVDPSLAYYVDDLMIYSDATGTTSIFPDDFELYFVGDSLDTDNEASPYNSSTSEAVVAEQP